VATVNEEYLDALLRHQIFLLRASGSIRNKVIKLLNATEEEIADKIRGKLAASPGNLKKLEQLLKEISIVRNKSWDLVDRVWLEELTELTTQEPTILKGITSTVLPVSADLKLPASSLMETLVKTSTFQGRTLKEWSKSIRNTDLRRMSDQIKIGVVQGESSKQIARRVVGTAALKGRDGVLQITRHNAEAITRTAVNRFSNLARHEFNKLNSDIVEKELYVATLDSRTTPICRSLDGKVYDIDKGKFPPLHFGCRSLRVAIFDGEIIGERPSKPTTERLLVKQYAAENNLGKISSRKGLPRGHKGAFDAFAKKEIRAITGQVPAKTSYNEWLGRQSHAFQDDVLGKTKGKLFRDGKLPLDKFVNRRGDELTLNELARKHKDAFKEAGLDSEDFIK
jgi:SPP1 gp7 family putative phage head morphogenesis protein